MSDDRSMNEHQSRLLELLKTKAFAKREVTLSSGRKSNFYIDCKQVTLSAEGAFLCGKVMFSIVESLPDPIHGVGGPTLGADPLVTAVSYTSYLEAHPLAAFIIRKEPKGHGTGQWIEGLNGLPSGARVAILEDVVTSGASSLRAIEKAREAGLQVLALICLVDRDEGGRAAIEETGTPVFSVFRRGDFFTSTPGI
jgi:orotate phosphoribosyltransferase